MTGLKRAAPVTIAGDATAGASSSSRPVGNKRAKMDEVEKKQIEKENKLALETAKASNAIAQEKLQLYKEEVAARKLQMDDALFAIDLTKLDDISKEYYTLRKKKILEALKQ